MTMEDEGEKKELVIITGMSGAGKSETMNFFEDREYFCIDNFPINLFQYLNEIFISSGKRNQVAIAIDVRNQEFIEQLTKQLEILDKEEISHTMIYLDARTDVLLSRYELSRRKHPLNMYDTLLANIKAERKIIKDFMVKADLVIDTSTLTVKKLQEILEKEFSGQRKKISVNLTSFGFKYGIPLDLHLMFDLRFLPNPYYIDNLKNKGISSINFIIGGSNGVNKEIKNSVDMKLKFSYFTFPHQLMRLILLEQIYRWFAISNNIKYHK